MNFKMFEDKASDKIFKVDSLSHNLLLGFAAFFIATLFFMMFPTLDLSVSRLFQLENNRTFILNKSVFGSEILRTIFRTIYAIAILLSILGLVKVLRDTGLKLTAKSRKWLFLFLGMTIGPGLVANVIFKANWGRARPIHVEQLGSHFKKNYSLPLVISDQCKGKNCSFVSGESSSIFALFFTLALAFSGFMRQRMLYLALFMGSAAGLMRMAQGGHFFSDVIFSGIFMWLSTLFMWWLLFEFKPFKQKTDEH